jgi:hypothetical protein
VQEKIVKINKISLIYLQNQHKLIESIIELRKAKRRRSLIEETLAKLIHRNQSVKVGLIKFYQIKIMKA